MKPTTVILTSLLAFSPSLFAEPNTEAKEPTKTKPAVITPPSAPKPAVVTEAPPLDPAVMKTNSSYGFGYRAGRQFANDTTRYGVTAEDIDREAFMSGLFEAFSGKESTVPQEEISVAFTALQKMVQDREKMIGEKNLAAGLKFLEENGKKDGITTTASGLQYQILTKGEGETYKAPAQPTKGPDRTQFMIKYTGTLVDGSEFDSSKDKVVPMGMSTVPGFKEALTTMSTGSTWRIFLKPELAYGPNRKSAKIGPNSTLIFDLSLEKIVLPTVSPTQPGGPRRPTAVSPPVRIPIPPKSGDASGKPGAKRATVVSPPVRVTFPKKDERKKSAEENK